MLTSENAVGLLFYKWLGTYGYLGSGNFFNLVEHVGQEPFYSTGCRYTVSNSQLLFG